MLTMGWVPVTVLPGADVVSTPGGGIVLPTNEAENMEVVDIAEGYYKVELLVWL